MNFFNKPDSTLSSDMITVNVVYNTIRIVDFEDEDKDILIEVSSNAGNTLLDFSKAKDYNVYCYNENGHLDSKYLAYNNKSNFIIGTQYKSIFLERCNSSILTKQKMIITTKKFKYLKYLPKPIHLEKGTIDFVDDSEFIQKDDRIPLLLITQHGIFPTKENYAEKPTLDYRILEGLGDRLVGFIGRPYLSNNERKGIIFKYTDAEFIVQITKDPESVNLGLWS
ncbi:hypothetical protein [Psychroflexus planctonicus]|uniref:Uncharacterized protein n=1 Tax=Psychroflexus planctonicus TaxID=1526575 RepID=A0ABQ1SPM7_9FLAO|nr:hypothetical protein [Psychroflexus planctonicus]GGE44915.1 hypothetical protein GCM10010832_26090 [Psychroflexus planctonicus]